MSLKIAKTYSPKAAEAQADWYIIDATTAHLAAWPPRLPRFC